MILSDTVSILITKDGDLVNPFQPLMFCSSLTGATSFTMLRHQVSIELFDDIIEQPDGMFTPSEPIIDTSGLSGTININIKPSKYAPYTVTISPSNVIDISEEQKGVMLQWLGTTYSIEATCHDIVGANYINLLVSRGL